MLTEYLTAALESAHFEIIEDDEPYFGHIPALQGVWATGKTLDECRRNLASALEDWVLSSIASGQDLPIVDSVALTASTQEALAHGAFCMWTDRPDIDDDWLERGREHVRNEWSAA